jgi:serine phosphatase RsbU (regulator of sigma subunit)
MRNLCAQIANLLSASRGCSNKDDDPEMVRGIQDRLTPSSPSSFPTVSGIECAAQCERSGNLGGDFFDLSGSNSAGLTAAIGNVAVAGNPGCILMTGLQACLRSLGRHGVELPDLFDEMNRMFWEIAPENTHASLFSGRINAGRERLHYVNAGHQAALVVRRDGRVERLEPNAPALGLSRSSAYRQRAIAFGPGDTLIALSDGVTEAAGPLDIAGCERALLEMVLRERSASVRELPARILNLVDSLAGPHTLDRTIVVVHCKDARVRDAHDEDEAAQRRILTRAVSAAA